MIRVLFRKFNKYGFHTFFMPRIPSWQYRVYKEEETWSSTARTIYEKLARGAGRILNIEPDEHTSKTLKDAIEFSHMKISPGDVTSLTLLTIFSILIPTMVLILLNLWFGWPGLEIGNGVLIIGLSKPNHRFNKIRTIVGIS